ncbi:MAG: T9SS type A sorting domain-containing protein, partial [Flavobacteriaceae bacterium]
ITVPSGISALDIWIYPNYGGTAPGSAIYDNLRVSRVANAAGKNISSSKSSDALNSIELAEGTLVNNLNSIIASPNPTSGFLYLNLASLMDIEIHCIVFNSLQQKILTASFDKNHGVEGVLDLKDLSEGVYYLQIQSIYGTAFKSIIVQK